MNKKKPKSKDENQLTAKEPQSSLDKDSLFTTEELAARWKLKPNTLKTWRSLGKGPEYFHLDATNKMVRYTLESILKYEEKMKEKGVI